MQSLVFITTVVPLVECVTSSVTPVTETLSLNKQNKTAAILYIHSFPPSSVVAAGGFSGYLPWIFQACSYALGLSALHFV